MSGANCGPHTLRNDRFGTLELLVRFCSLRENGQTLGHHFLGNCAADRELFAELFDVCVARSGSDLIERTAVDGAVGCFFSEQRDDAVGGRSAKDQIGRTLKYLIQLKDRAQRLAQFVKQLEYLCLAPQVLDLGGRCRGRFEREVGPPAHKLVDRYLDLRMAERRVVKAHGRLFDLYLRRRTQGFDISGHDVGTYGKLDAALADHYDVTGGEGVFELHLPVDKNVIDAAGKPPFLDKPIDDLKPIAVEKNISVLARDAAVVEHDTVLFALPRCKTGR